MRETETKNKFYSQLFSYNIFGRCSRTSETRPTRQFTIYRLADNRSPERVHAATVARRVSRRVSGDGADGREPVPGDPDGSRPRAHVVPPLPDAVRHQALALRRHYPQGG